MDRTDVMTKSLRKLEKGIHSKRADEKGRRQTRRVGDQHQRHEVARARAEAPRIPITPLALVHAVAEALPAVRPTVFPSVPRVYEKVYAGVTAKFAQATGLKRRLIDWALPVGRRVSELRQAGRPAVSPHSTCRF